MSDDATRAAEDAIWAVARERAGTGGFDAIGPVEVLRIAVEAARPIIAAEALRKAADVISADEFTADDPTSYDPDYWCGIIEAASYLRRAAEGGVDR